MAGVQTVTGECGPGELGLTLVHEHLLCELSCYWNPGSAPALAGLDVAPDVVADLRSAPFAAFDNLALRSLREAAEALTLFADAGGGAVVEVSSQGIGRQPRALAWLSEQTGVTIIAGCGYYIADSHPPGMSERAVEALVDEFVRELTEGIAGTEIRAGVLGEIGVGSWPPHPDELKVLTAAARAQSIVPRAAIIHCPPVAGSVPDFARLLIELGFDPSITVLGHLDVRLRSDIDAYAEVAAMGFQLGLDTFGREAYYPERRAQHPADELRVDAVVALVERGLECQVYLSQDICFRHELGAYGGVGYHHILARILPRLEAKGVSRDQCAGLLTANPARLLAGAP